MQKVFTRAQPQLDPLPRPLVTAPYSAYGYDKLFVYKTFVCGEHTHLSCHLRRRIRLFIISKMLDGMGEGGEGEDPLSASELLN